MMGKISVEIFIKVVSTEQKQRISRVRKDCRRGKQKNRVAAGKSS